MGLRLLASLTPQGQGEGTRYPSSGHSLHSEHIITPIPLGYSGPPPGLDRRVPGGKGINHLPLNLQGPALTSFQRTSAV